MNNLRNYNDGRKAALMRLNSAGTDYEYICGGVLIDETTVVTGEKKNWFLKPVSVLDA